MEHNVGEESESRVGRCSFCHKTQDRVRKLLAGPDGVFICDECVFEGLHRLYEESAGVTFRVAYFAFGSIVKIGNSIHRGLHWRGISN